MTSKIVVNNIEADAGVSTVTFHSEMSQEEPQIYIAQDVEIGNVNTW